MAARQSKKKRPMREHKEDRIRWPLEEGVFDRDSLMTLTKLIRRGFFRTMDYCIAEGKEANIYRAKRDDGGFIAVKMYRLRTPSFQHMQQYMQGDRRFSHGERGAAGVIFTWTQKEYSNLVLMDKLGVRAPKPLSFMKNILVMEFLGVDGVPYSTLSDTGSEDPNGDYELILSDLRKLHAGGLVHGDVSEYNVLMTDKGPYLIDCGQAVLLTHPRAEEFYARDLHNIYKYFAKYPKFDKDKYSVSIPKSIMNSSEKTENEASSDQTDSASTKTDVSQNEPDVF